MVILEKRGFAGVSPEFSLILQFFEKSIVPSQMF